MGQSFEQHPRKNVQMHCLTRNLAARLEKDLRENNKLEEFGDVFAYNRVYFGKCGGECVTVEEFIPGTFEKHVNNTGDICGDTESDLKKAECFVHYSYIRSKKKLMALDIQGCNYFLCDPEVASEESREDGEFLFCTGNLSTEAIKHFCEVHVCNEYCKLLDLPGLS